MAGLEHIQSKQAAPPTHIEASAERLTAAAIKLGDAVYTAPRHAEITYTQLSDADLALVENGQAVYGYYTDQERFVDTAEAEEVARVAGQLKDGQSFESLHWDTDRTLH